MPCFLKSVDKSEILSYFNNRESEILQKEVAK